VTISVAHTVSATVATRCVFGGSRWSRHFGHYTTYMAVKHQYTSHPLVCSRAAPNLNQPDNIEDVDVQVGKPDAVTPAWQEAIELLQSGQTITTTIRSVNKSGVLVSIGRLTGFVPYKLMNRTLLANKPQEGWSKTLVGQPITVKVTQVVVPERRLICSEKAALLDKASEHLSVGDLVTGIVTSLHSFGAFVEVHQPESCAGTEIILPLREVSWDWISNVAAKLNKGDEVVVRVIDVVPPPRPKVVVSLKRMQEDPLKETFDKVLPLDNKLEWGEVGDVPVAIPAGVDDILEELSNLPKVQEVTLGRRAEEKRTVSQDLELWISRDAVADGFNLVARTGKAVLEIHVVTDMSAEEMRSAVQDVLKRVS